MEKSEIAKRVEDILFDEVERDITDNLLESFESFSFNFSKMKPTKELYERLKEDDNWALYDNSEDYDEYYPNWKEELIKRYEIALKENEDPLDAEMDFLESDELSDISANIASGIIIKAIKNERKKMKK